MKNLVFLLSLTILLCGGCKYFKKPAKKSVETITTDTTDTTDSSAYYNAAEPVQPAASVPVKAGTAKSGKYYMIVGCFTVGTNAEKYAEKLRGMGYETEIIPGRDNFQMVAARAYNNYRESVSEIDKFRTDVTPNAWVYLQK